MRASEYKQSEGGLYLPLHATLKGRVRWQVLDERGVPEIPRTPSGVPIGPVEGVEQDNLITDLGMDAIAEHDPLFITTNSVWTWRRRMAVGTGSALPDFSDTALSNEVQREATSGSFGDGSQSYELDQVNDVWRAVAMVTRLVTMNTDRNLTEFGFSQETSGNIWIRELLRDGGGNPISVALLNGKSLRVDHTVTVEIPAPPAGFQTTIAVDEYDAGNNLVNSIPYDVTYGCFVREQSGGAPSPSALSALFYLWSPRYGQTSTGMRRLYSELEAGYKRVIDYQSVSPTVAMAPIAYVPGTYQRIKRGTFSTGEGNIAHRGVVLTYAHSGDQFGGLAVIFDDPATYTKVSTDTLRAGVICTWARA